MRRDRFVAVRRRLAGRETGRVCSSSVRDEGARLVVSWNVEARYFDVFSATPALAIERGTPFGVRWRVVTDYVGSRREPRRYVRRCQQIRIWPHRGRARQREMKFDRSAPHTRAPLSSRSSSSTLPLPLLLAAPFDVSSANERRFLDFTSSLVAKWRFSHLQGAPRASDTSRLRECSLSPSPPFDWLVGPYTLFYTILFYLPLPCRRLRSLGAQFKRASLVPSRHLFTNTSHDLLP